MHLFVEVLIFNTTTKELQISNQDIRTTTRSPVIDIEKLQKFRPNLKSFEILFIRITITALRLERFYRFPINLLILLANLYLPILSSTFKATHLHHNLININFSRKLKNHPLIRSLRTIREPIGLNRI